MTVIGNPVAAPAAAASPSTGGGGSSFRGLASSALPSLGGESLARPTWKRSLKELAASNLALMGGGGSGGGTIIHNHNTATGVTPAAQMLLGSRTDFGSLLSHKKDGSGSSGRYKTSNNKSGSGRTANTYDPASRYSFDAMSGGGIEAVVRRHRDGILERVLKDQREQTQRLVEKAVDRQIERDLEEERNWWIRELVGDRNLVDATRGSTQEDGGGGRGRLLVAGYGHGPGGSTAITNNGGNNMFATGCDPKAVKEHLDVVRGLKPSADPLGVVARFDNLARAETFGGGGYKNAWMILASMLPKMRQRMSPIDAARGAQAHFCRQYQTIIEHHVRTAGLSGQDTATPVRYSGSGGSVATVIASYVKLVSGSNASIWEILYYCTSRPSCAWNSGNRKIQLKHSSQPTFFVQSLPTSLVFSLDTLCVLAPADRNPRPTGLRCGNARAAQSVLNATPAGEIEFAQQRLLSLVIEYLSARQGSAACMYENGSPMVKAEDRLALLNAHEMTKNLEPDNQHKLSVLALLGGKQLESFSTVEDYLFGNLWVALMDKENPIRQIEVIGASVRKYGPSHFAGDGSGEWGYVLPLIATQQFATALSYLVEAGGNAGLMQATHLGLVLALARVNVEDLGDSGSSTGGSSSTASRDIVTALLVNYAVLTESEPSAGVPASLEYLLKIPNTEESIHQVAKLITRSTTDQIDVLVGVLDTVGNRKNSVLDEKLPENDVSSILATAGELLQKQASDRSKVETSAKLFMLGYHHTKLVQLLNEQISPVDVVDEDKIFWMQQSKLFYDQFLAKRSNVLDSIEREGKSKLVDTNRSLLELRTFFEIYRRRTFEEAFGAVSRTGLLPLSQRELNEKSSRFRDLDPILKKQFPGLLVAAVECLSELFHRLKSESRGLPPAVVDRLRELQFLARYLFAFAGLINMPSGCMTDIQQRRTNMIV